MDPRLEKAWLFSILLTVPAVIVLCLALIWACSGCATSQAGRRRLVERHLEMCIDGQPSGMGRADCVTRSYADCEAIGLEAKCAEDSSEPKYSRIP